MALDVPPSHLSSAASMRLVVFTLQVFVVVIAIAALDFGKMTTFSQLILRVRVARTGGRSASRYAAHEGAMLEACSWMERPLQNLMNFGIA